MSTPARRPFDPYHVWLGISPAHRPIDHYRLLGLAPLEHDPEVIQNAADARMAHVRTFQTGQYAELSQKILNELSAAKVLLLNPAQKRRYDQALQARLTATEGVPMAQLLPAAPPAEDYIAPAPAEEFSLRLDSPAQVRGAQRPWGALLGGGAALLLIVGGLAWLLMSGAAAQPVAQQTPAAVESGASTAAAPAASEERSHSPRASGAPSAEEPAAGAAAAPAEHPEPSAEKPRPPAPATPEVVVERVEGEKSRELSDLLEGLSLPPAGNPSPTTGPSEVPNPEAPRESERRPKGRNQPGAGKAVVPTTDERTAALALVKEAFQKDFAAARTPVEKLDLAKKLLTAAASRDEAPANRYVMLEQALDSAEKLGDPITGWQAIDVLHHYFEIDALAMRTELVKSTSRFAQTPAQSAFLTQLAINLVMDGATADRHDDVLPLTTLAVTAAARSNDNALKDAARFWNQQLRALAREHKRVQETQPKLASDPADAGANLILGTYLCAYKEQWGEGLAALAKGSDAKLAKLAAHDLANPRQPAEQLELGDAWWDYAATQGAGVKGAFQRRAGQWYRWAQRDATPLVKARLETRLKSIPPTPQKYSLNVPAVPGLGSPRDGQPALAAAADPKRHAQAAVAVIQLGGSVRILGQRGTPRKLEELPQGAYSLEAVYLENDRITDEHLRLFNGLTGLRELRLAGQFSDDGLAQLATLTELTQLSLRSRGLVGGGLVRLRCGTLTQLMLAGENLGDAALKGLAGFSRLEHLHVQGDQFTGFGLLDVKLPMLRNLNLQGARLGDDACDALRNLPGLTSLHLTGGELTGARFEGLRDAPRLTQLSLSGAQVTDAALEHIAQLKGLEMLSITNAAITGAGFAKLEEMPRLSQIHLRNCARFGAESLVHLNQLGALQSLALLEMPTVNDPGLAHLKAPALRSLSIEQAPVSDASVAVISRLTNLRELRVSRTGITPAGIQALERALPNCRVRG